MLRIVILALPFICWLDLSGARPSEEPTRFNLGTQQGESDAENVVPSKLAQAEELLGRIADAIRIGGGRFVNSIILARNIVVDRAKRQQQQQQLTGETANNPVSTRGNDVTKSDKFNNSRRSLISVVQSTTPRILFYPVERATARLENETAQAILERPKPDNVIQTLNSFLTPRPIVDRIKEEEKYGNNGDRFSGIGRTIVNAYENFSNFLNRVVDLPVNTAKQTSRGITDALNQLGARLIGLE